MKRDAVVVTSNRIVLYRPGMLGRINFEDYSWQDVQNVHMKQGMLGSEITVQTVDGRGGKVTYLDKEQSKRLYSLAQQKEHEWREKRRVRQMEESRAAAGGVVVHAPTATQAPAESAAPAQGPVEKLVQAREHARRRADLGERVRVDQGEDHLVDDLTQLQVMGEIPELSHRDRRSFIYWNPARCTRTMSSSSSSVRTRSNPASNRRGVASPEAVAQPRQRSGPSAGRTDEQGGISAASALLPTTSRARPGTVPIRGGVSRS